MYKKILAAIDLEDARQPVVALNAAAELAKLYKASVHLLHVIPEAPSYVTAELPSSIMEKTHETTNAMMKAYAANSRFKGIETTFSVSNGEVYRNILKSADETSTDLIIICAHRKGIADFLLGSNAARIVNHAKCSVFVVRNEVISN
jgi:nucleotide-binding universal stress UspA family protein